MDFARKAWKLLVAIKDGLALLFLLLFFALLFGALSGNPNAGGFIPNGALLLRLNGTITEQPTPVDPATALLAGSSAPRQFRRADLVRAIDAAASDDRVKAIVLDLDSFLGGGQVAVGDVAEALARARRAGKRVMAYATAYTRQSYQLAAHANEVWTEPGGGALIAGPGGSQLYYRGLMDRLGVTANIYRVGTFKSAVEPFLRTDQSPEAEAAARAYTTEVWDRWRAQVRTARPAAQIDSFVNDPVAAVRAAGGDNAEASRRAGLVDRVGSRLAFERRVGAVAGVADDDRPWRYNRITLRNWLAANPESTSGEAIAVIPVVGNIVDGLAPAGSAGGETIARQIFRALDDTDIKAIVLRVDSPGGSVTASERIRTALLEAQARRLPIVVSMGNVAASGGYWISTPASRIFAEPDTITGSIGVFGILPSFERALGNIGVTADGIATTPLSGQPDVFGGVNDSFNGVAQASVEHTYARFTGLVAASRRLDIARVREIAEGRVWAGGTARQIGLVDRFGGLEDAMKEAARLARINPDAIHARYFEEGPSGFAAILESLMGGGGVDPDSDDPLTGGATAMASASEPRGWFAHAGWMQRARLAQALGDVRLLIGSNSMQASCLECGDWLSPRGISGGDAQAIDRWLTAMPATR